MRVLTDEQLAEVDRIINETPIETNYEYAGDNEGSIEVDDAKGTLRGAARRVRKYLASLGS